MKMLRPNTFRRSKVSIAVCIASYAVVMAPNLTASQPDPEVSRQWPLHNNSSLDFSPPRIGVKMQPMNIQNAWNLVPGTGYVGIVDMSLMRKPQNEDNVDANKYRTVTTRAFDSDFIGDVGSSRVKNAYSGSKNDTSPTRIISDDLLPNYRSHLSLTIGGSGLGHADHVAGILAAKGDNGIGVKGVCPSCSIVSSTVSANAEDTSNATGYDIAHMIHVGVPTFNMSWFAGADKADYLDSNGELVYQVDHPNEPPVQTVSGSLPNICSGPLSVVCEQLDRSIARDIIPVAASGNHGLEGASLFPASRPGVVSVGAYGPDYIAEPYSNYNQSNSDVDLMAPGSQVLSTIPIDFYAAYARCGDAYSESVPVYSTFLSDHEAIDFWVKANRPMNADDPGGANDGLGSCSGTSMAAPHVTALISLMRSIDPLMKSAEVKKALFESAQFYNSQAANNGKTPTLGYGSPDAEQAIKNMLGIVNGEVLKNRLTPLFSLYSNNAENSFYTSVPQMAYSAIDGTLYPNKIENAQHGLLGGATSTYSEQAYGTAVKYPTGQYQFSHEPISGPEPVPNAEVYVFTTDKNPINPSQPLVPLYRMSYAGAPVLNFQTCELGNESNADHTYTTEQAGIDYYSSANHFLYRVPDATGTFFNQLHDKNSGAQIAQRRACHLMSYNTTLSVFNTGNYGGGRTFDFRYKLDGVEGYVFSTDYPQPQGTEKLIRRYNAARDDHAIFPESKLQQMVAAGYQVPPVPAGVTANEVIGYVYTNTDTDNDGLIDGFESILGTNPSVADTDGDGVSDGQEVNGYPRTDPCDNACNGSSTPVPIVPSYVLQESNFPGAASSTNIQVIMDKSVGYEFTPLVSGKITALGARFGSSNKVRLHDTSNAQLLREVTISSNVGNGNNWSYQSVSPISVQAGKTYTISAVMEGSYYSSLNLGSANSMPVETNGIRLERAVQTWPFNWGTINSMPSNGSGSTYLYGLADFRFVPD